METPLKITFQGIEPSPALDTRIRTWMKRLEGVHHRISRCEVVVDKPHNHQRSGLDFDVHVSLTLPRGRVITSGVDHDPYVAVRDAFRAARRQLVDRP